MRRPAAVPPPPTTTTHPSHPTPPGENEANVRWLLDSFPCMRLVPQAPHLGGPGLVGGGLLTREEAPLVQRFDPDAALDTIGFFISKFEKVASVPES